MRFGGCGKSICSETKSKDRRAKRSSVLAKSLRVLEKCTALKIIDTLAIDAATCGGYRDDAAKRAVKRVKRAEESSQKTGGQTARRLQTADWKLKTATRDHTRRSRLCHKLLWATEGGNIDSSFAARLLRWLFAESRDHGHDHHDVRWSWGPQNVIIAKIFLLLMRRQIAAK